MLAVLKHRCQVPSRVSAASIQITLRSLSRDSHVFDEQNNIVGGYTPVTKRLWQQRYRWDESSLESRDPQTHFIPKPPKTTEVTYPFSSDAILREHYRNPWGSVRVGRLMEDMDSLAGYLAYDHCDDNNPSTRPPILVTATVEAIHMNTAAPLDLFKNMKLGGKVVWTGGSSMDIMISLWQDNDDAARDKPQMTALFTFVARDPTTGKAQKINPLQPETDADKVLFAERQAIADDRKAHRAEEKKTGIKYTQQQTAWAHELLSAMAIKRDLPALADPNTLLMSETCLENTFTTQPQQRNIHGRIFGGFLMRRAFELAHSTAYLLTASRPRTIDIDQIVFKRPVEIGDLVRFRSRVLRAWNAPIKQHPNRGLVHVQVSATVVKPESLQTFETNTFNFIFAVNRRVTDDLKVLDMPNVLPVTEDQAMHVCEYYGPEGKRLDESFKVAEGDMNT